MGLLDVLFKSAEKAAARAVKTAVSQKVNEVVRDKVKEGLDDLIPTGSNTAPKPKAASQMAQSASKYDATPDMPQQFGYGTGWLCIKGCTAEEIITILGLKNAQAANWKSGMNAVENNFMKKVFISPVVNGYVLAVGYIPFGVKHTVKEELEILDDIALQVDEMSCFSTQNTVDLHVWAKYAGGKLVRGYGWIGESGEVYINKGELTPEEISLGFTNLIQDSQCDWNSVELPTEENVMQISAAWGVDTSFPGAYYEAGTGFVCDI